MKKTSTQMFPIHQLTPENFPQLSFWNIPDAPKKIFVQGSQLALSLLDRLNTNGLAVVGTRRPSQRSLSFMNQTLRQLAGTQLIVVSGFARGVDRMAHQLALQAKVPTIAIIGTGHGIDYPRGQDHLRKQLLNAGGLIVSEYAPLTAARPYFFKHRNRLIAGWTRATVVIEAGPKSGALSTAEHAAQYGRECFATPCHPGEPGFEGNQKLLDDQAAQPFWGLHSLGQVWLRLATQPSLPLVDFENPKAKELWRFVQIQTKKQGGARVEELINWSCEKNWNTKTLFDSMHYLIQHSRMIEESGIFRVL